MNTRTRRPAREKGFTLVELLVVMSILAVLAAVVIPTVTGVNTSARSTAQPTDINEVQNAATHFNADSGVWPTKASSAAATTAWAASALPGTAFTSSGNTYTFTVNSIAGLAFTGTYGTKTYVPDYMSTPKHSTDVQISVPATDTKSFTINKAGVSSTVVLSNTSGSVQTFDVWGIDGKGGIWIFVDKDTY